MDTGAPFQLSLPLLLSCVLDVSVPLRSWRRLDFLDWLDLEPDLSSYVHLIFNGLLIESTAVITLPCLPAWVVQGCASQGDEDTACPGVTLLLLVLLHRAAPAAPWNSTLLKVFIDTNGVKGIAFIRMNVWTAVLLEEEWGSKTLLWSTLIVEEGSFYTAHDLSSLLFLFWKMFLFSIMEFTIKCM